MQKKFYISDMHFGHKRILEFDNRPFFTLEEMKEQMIENWNSVVQKGDSVHILGDMFWDNEEAPEILARLNGNKHLILGNHDRVNGEMKKWFVSCDTTIKIVKDSGRHVVLCHYPIACWQGQDRDPDPWIHLYGHIHAGRDTRPYETFGKLWSMRTGRDFLAFNVGCMLDYMRYTPRTLDEILDANGIT